MIVRELAVANDSLRTEQYGDATEQYSDCASLIHSTMIDRRST